MRDQGKAAPSGAVETVADVPFGGVQAAADVLLRPGQPIFYRIPEVMKMLALGRSVVFEQLRTGRLASVRQGRSRRITVFAILKYIELLEREHAQEVAR